MERKRKKLGIKFPASKNIDENPNEQFKQGQETELFPDNDIFEDDFSAKIDSKPKVKDDFSLDFDDKAEEDLFPSGDLFDDDFGINDDEILDINQPEINEDPNETEQIIVTPPKQEVHNSTRKALVVDPETTYIFVFGEGSAGKSVMMSGLIRYLDVYNEYGPTHVCCDTSAEQTKGDLILDRMRENVSKGKYVDRTGEIDNTENIFSTEINLEFVPNNRKKPKMPFCILEMAGEDLKQIGPQNNGKLDGKINGYLHHPDCNILFICTVDPDKPLEGDRLINRFLDYTRSIGREENPILVSINKWDKERDNFNSNVNKYFETNIPTLNRSTQNENRDFTRMGYSIGQDIDKKNYIYDPKDSEKLFKWLYEKATGEKIDETKKRSFWNK